MFDSIRNMYTNRDRPKFVFVFGAENDDFGWFRPFSFSAETVFIVFFFFRFRPKISAFSAEIFFIDNAEKLLFLAHKIRLFDYNY
jgi:hypothetical protein